MADPSWSELLVTPLLLQVHAMCKDALAKAPSCPPALAALAEYYFSVAEAAASCASAARAVLLCPEAAGAKGAGGGGAGGRQHAVQQLQSALSALSASAGNAEALLDGLAVADPIRTMYWAQRHQALQHLQLQIRLQPPPGFDVDAMQ